MSCSNNEGKVSHSHVFTLHFKVLCPIIFQEKCLSQVANSQQMNFYLPETAVIAVQSETMTVPYEYSTEIKNYMAHGTKNTNPHSTCVKDSYEVIKM